LSVTNPSGAKPFYRRRWFLVTGGVLLLIIILSAVTSPASKKRAGSSTSSTTALAAEDDDDLGAPGAPTVAGSVVATGSGAQPGPSACRSGDPLANVYHPNRLKVIQACMTVSGTVRSVHHEDDGDVHFDLALDPAYTEMLTAANMAHQHGWLVVELVPADEPGCTTGQPPKPASGTYNYGVCSGADESPPSVGSHVYATGPHVLDEDHGGWAEIHPAWAISGSPPGPITTTTTTSPPATIPPLTTEAPPTEPPVVATTPPPPPPPAHSCSAGMSNPTPAPGAEETVNITSNVPNAPVTVTKHYRTTTSYDDGSTNSAGSASIPFSTGSPTPGYTVEVDVSINNGEAACSTSFTPT